MEQTLQHSDPLQAAAMVLARHGIQLPKFDAPPYCLTPFEQALAIIEQATVTSAKNTLFLQFGMQLGLQHGRSHFAQLQQQTWLQQLVSAELAPDKDTVNLIFKPRHTQYHPGFWEALLAYTHARCPWSRQQQLEPITLHLPFSAKAQASMYPRFFPSVVQSDASHLIVSMSDTQFALWHRSRENSIESHSTDSQHSRNSAVNIVEKTMNLLASSLHNPLSQQQIAEQLLLSERTFKRRLHDCGYCYQTLLAEVRLQQARCWLETDYLTVSEISVRLGYANVANFSKAFKKWAGCSPSFWGDKKETIVHSNWPPLERAF
ncbi:hypothetical protein CHH28_16745 [Bacterioplanes sanyensis]|uniref:HTH araC/xylS-type domain-containing protein n=1 Tax=Bacterioplanes sanyensis TaxID=1249553 RepID=A0A222FPQ4_9GAMM|nr:helix-turn-helix transcriptional regulator [Bacterioplanes sanyensis]ASP40223.1 hypothetical protein CHH28_16745 [Bacterioplanes sanyensis]